MRALLVEDSRFISNVLKKEFTSRGCEVDQAFSLKEAYEKLSQKRYDLIVLDLHLPDGDGTELLLKIQSVTDSKIIVLTSESDVMVREELFKYGILDYVVKDTNLTNSIQEIVRIMKSIEKRSSSKVLIIDDSKLVCKQVEKILKTRGYQVDKAYSANEGWEKLDKNGPYDLLLLDLQLTDGDGMELLSKIRSDKRFDLMPVIILSGTITPDTTREVLKNGANDIIKKPFIHEEFITKIDTWIDYFKKKKELEEKNRNLEELIKQEVEKNLQKDRLLLHQNRHAQMGEIVSMIAHQWRQPLNVIGQAINILRLKCKDPSIQKILQKSVENLDYLNQTIEDFRMFFKPNNKKTLTSWKKIVQKALKIAKPMLNSNPKIYIEDKSQEFECYENELMQVVINILKNSDDAFIERDIKNPQIFIKIDGRKIEIKDNAGGVSNEIIDHIFDPYFSTKGENGTGLGLYMSKIIVTEHCKGKIDVSNTEDGTKFTIEV